MSLSDFFPGIYKMLGEVILRIYLADNQYNTEY